MTAAELDERLGRNLHSRELVRRVDAASIAGFAAETVERARYFLADTLATGIAGKCNPATAKVADAMAGSGPSGTVVCLGRLELTLPHTPPQ